ncbi:hypothetical protein Cgig2_029799 [Carnegiea gigantea]|uniref:Mitochondrial carrier protein n=1 Tax=Carnegiea gigantea TaxID=171969 RepID=A0A9Q1QJF1_9CARY|nr:hypothetical protein Cgig2_029799 [Carnegiea gigantea]
MKQNQAILAYRAIPGIETCNATTPIELADFKRHQRHQFKAKWLNNNGGEGGGNGFACLTLNGKREEAEFAPTTAQLVQHPLAFVALVPKDAALFAAGAIAGAAAKTFTAPLDRIKLLMQTHGVQVGQESTKKAIGFVEVIRIIPYSAVQLFSYETYKVTYPLDVLRLRLAVETGHRTMSQVALSMLREEGIASFYNGLGPSLIGIAPYIAGEEVFTEKYQERPETSLATALVSATLATLTCYPLDTIRRQMQMRVAHTSPFLMPFQRFLPNALKTLPSSSIRLTTFDTVKSIIAAGEKEYQRIVEENRRAAKVSSPN